MINPIPKTDLFVTPKTIDDLMERAKSAEEWSIMCMTLNFCHATLQEELNILEERAKRLEQLNNIKAAR